MGGELGCERLSHQLVVHIEKCDGAVVLNTRSVFLFVNRAHPAD